MGELFDPLAEPFRTGIGQRALLEVLLLAIVCGPLGAWVLLYRQSYAAESISHAALPGLVIAALAGIPLLVGAAAGLGAAVVLLGLATRLRGVDSDAAVAVAVTALFGFGTLLALTASTPPRLDAILFGDPLGVSGGDLVASAALAIAALLALAGIHRPLSLVAFDRQSAASLGTRPARVEAWLLGLLALTILIAIQALGTLLVVAMLIAPGATALRLRARLGAALVTAALVGCAAGVAGLYASHYLETAAGASIALASVLGFALTLVFGPAPQAAVSATRSPVETLGGAR
jgi:ABC-type Mn2+/Zn2+ transport system permease subunit